MSSRKQSHRLILSTDALKRFFEKVRFPPSDIDHPDLCWLWTGAGRGNGYGSFRLSPEDVIDAHVIMWRLSNDGAEVPAGRLIMHTCDVKLCIRPDHLKLGTYSENMSTDSAAVGRKMTREQVLAIRSMLDQGIFQHEIAARMNCKRSAVRDISRGRTYRSW